MKKLSQYWVKIAPFATLGLSWVIGQAIKWATSGQTNGGIIGGVVAKEITEEVTEQIEKMEASENGNN